LLAYPIKAAKNSSLIDDVYVSSNDDKLKKESKKYGAEIVDRPDYLAEADTTGIEVLRHFAEEVDADYYVLLQATFVPISLEIINGCIKAMDDGIYSIAICVSPTKDKKLYWKKDEDESRIVPWYNEWMNGQQFERRVLVENGACYVFSRQFIEDGLDFSDKNIYASFYEYDGDYVDIDYYKDLLEARRIMRD
jgi:CMP-N-acetylneuraminic acid synthetase